MPARRLYKTRTEKLAANRAKSKRHYKKNKARILARRQRRLQQQAMTTETVAHDAHTTDEPIRSRLEKWIDHSNRVYRRLERIKGNDTDNEYIDRLFSMFITEYTAGRSAQHVFNDALATFRKFYDSMARCSAGILQEAGVGADFEDVEEKLTGIRSIIKCIEAMQCETMASKAILKS